VLLYGLLMPHFFFCLLLCLSHLNCGHRSLRRSSTITSQSMYFLTVLRLPPVQGLDVFCPLSFPFFWCICLPILQKKAAPVYALFGKASPNAFSPKDHFNPFLFLPLPLKNPATIPSSGSYFPLHDYIANIPLFVGDSLWHTLFSL